MPILVWRERQTSTVRQHGGTVVADSRNWGSQAFPETPSRIHRSRHRFGLRARRGVQVVALSVGGIGTAALAWLCSDYVAEQRVLVVRDAEMIRAESANADLQDALAKLRDELDASNRELQAAQARLAALAEEAQSRLSQQHTELAQQLEVSQETSANKAGRIAQLAHALDQAQHDLHQAEAERVTLMARLSRAEAANAEEQARQNQLKAGLEQAQKSLQQITIERDRNAGERDRLRTRLGEIERHSQLQQQQRAATPVAEAVPAPIATPRAAPAAPVLAAVPPPAAATAASNPAPTVRAEPMRAAAVSAAAGPHSGLAELERVLGSTGVDVARLFSRYGVQRGEGGPFVPAPQGATLAAGIGPDQLRGLVKALPLGAPLESYQLGSPFGARHDPFNSGAAFHTGLDLIAPYMTPVYATGASTVTFAGYREDYGKIVEIDHGNGLTTRYGHLHRFLVSVGQSVSTHTEIGLLGSSGRASGPHVHYEVLVNGEPQDPAKFLALARVIPVAQH